MVHQYAKKHLMFVVGTTMMVNDLQLGQPGFLLKENERERLKLIRLRKERNLHCGFSNV